MLSIADNTLFCFVNWSANSFSGQSLDCALLVYELVSKFTMAEIGWWYNYDYPANLAPFFFEAYLETILKALNKTFYL